MSIKENLHSFLNDQTPIYHITLQEIIKRSKEYMEALEITPEDCPVILNKIRGSRLGTIGNIYNLQLKTFKICEDDFEIEEIYIVYAFYENDLNTWISDGLGNHISLIDEESHKKLLKALK